MPRPPIDPDSFDKVNFIIDSWTTGCEAPWYIYIETMKPAALTAFFALLEFGLGDVVRGIFRPKGLGRRTGKRKGRWTKRLPAFPEIGNTIGKNIGHMTGAQGITTWSAGAMTLWRIDLAMQSALLLWLVADIAEDFVFNWTSLLYESYWCQDGPQDGFSYHSNTMGSMRRYSWKKMFYGNKDWDRGNPHWTFGSGATGSKPAIVTATAVVAKHPAFPPPDSFRIIVMNVATGARLADSGTLDNLDPAGSPAVCSGVVPPGTVFEVRSYMTGGLWANVGTGVVLGIPAAT